MKWADFDFVACYNDVDASMDFNIYVDLFELKITIPGNPFHQMKDTAIQFGSRFHAFVLNNRFYNNQIKLPEIEDLKFNFDFNFDFSLPTCLFG